MVVEMSWTLYPLRRYHSVRIGSITKFKRWNWHLDMWYVDKPYDKNNGLARFLLSLSHTSTITHSHWLGGHLEWVDHSLLPRASNGSPTRRWPLFLKILVTRESGALYSRIETSFGKYPVRWNARPCKTKTVSTWSCFKPSAAAHIVAWELDGLKL